MDRCRQAPHGGRRLRRRTSPTSPSRWSPATIETMAPTDSPRTGATITMSMAWAWATAGMRHERERQQRDDRGPRAAHVASVAASAFSGRSVGPSYTRPCRASRRAHGAGDRGRDRLLGITALRAASGPGPRLDVEDVEGLEVFLVCRECGTEFRVTRLGELQVRATAASRWRWFAAKPDRVSGSPPYRSGGPTAIDGVFHRGVRVFHRGDPAGGTHAWTACGKLHRCDSLVLAPPCVAR